MTDATDKIEAATDQVAAVAADVVESAVQDSATLIEHAQERADAAEELAEDLAAAALMTEIGKRATEAMEGLNECRSNLAALEQNVTEKLEAIKSQLTALATPQPVSLSIPIPSEKVDTVPEALEVAEKEAEAITAAVILPGNNVQSEAAPVVVPLKKPSRWI